MTCEKCWDDAYLRSRLSHREQHDCYLELIKERRETPCTPKQQAGQWWDLEKQIDKRVLRVKK